LRNSGLVSSSSTEYSTDEDNDSFPHKNIIMTLSPEEWKTIEPVKTIYHRHNQTRKYLTLPKKDCSHIIAEHLWEHTHLQCSLIFRRAKVYEVGQNYVSIVGRCKTCNSHFKGVIEHKPSPNSRYLIK